MRISLLGEVTARADGGAADLLAPLQPMHRLLVAVLALDAGQTVPMTTLESRLWDGYPPADPRGRLHTCASRVRAALRGASPGADGFIEATGGGYRLGVDRDAVDVHRFRVKATTARAQAGQDDDLAATLARDALREWGPETTTLDGREPLTGLTGRWAEGYRVTLHREHRDILLELAAAELRRGHAGRVLAEFAGLAAAEPGQGDERLAALLMRAYYQCGRQSEALSTYRLATESLRRKGIEAGRELRMLEKNIRNQDPSLEYPRDFTAAPGTGAQGHLVPAGGNENQEDTDEPEDIAPESATGTPGPASSGSRVTQGQHSGANFSQHNFGRTVVANQGTQHVNIGGADE